MESCRCDYNQVILFFLGKVVRLRPRDKRTLDTLVDSVSKVRGKTSSSEFVGLSLDFASSNIDNFLEGIIDRMKDDPIMQLMRNPARKGERNDSRRLEGYLYDTH